jgi:hypothetical protein
MASIAGAARISQDALRATFAPATLIELHLHCRKFHALDIGPGPSLRPDLALPQPTGSGSCQTARPPALPCGEPRG